MVRNDSRGGRQIPIGARRFVCRFTRRVLLGFMPLLMLACAQPSPLDNSAHQAIRSTLNEVGSGAPSAGINVPEDISRALLPPVAAAADKRGDGASQRRFDVVANNAPARDVLVGLAEGTAYSIVVHPDVSGNLSLDLKNVTLMEALEVVRNVHGYDFERAGNRIMIYGTGLRTRIFPVNYLNVGRRGSSQTTVSATGLNSSGGASGSGSGSTSSTGSGSGGGASGGSAGASVTTESNADFWADLKRTLESLVGNNDGKRVVVNAQASLVIVRATPAELDLVTQYLGLTHEAVNRQVVLEAKIVEVELNEGFQSGINWASLASPGSTDALFSQTGGGRLLTAGASEIAGAAGRLDPNSRSPIDASVTSAFGGMFSLTLSGKDFSAFMELLHTQGDVHVLSSPRVSTVNNQKAVIKVGDDEFFITSIEQPESSNTTNAAPAMPTVKLSAFFSGIALDVTPQIDGQDNIILHIHPLVSEVTQQTKSFVLGDQDYALPLASSNVQESDNVVRARSGQIVVIGGLMKEVNIEQNASVPVLSDLPLIGGLFRHQKQVRVKRELVILIKPTIVTMADRWRQVDDEMRDRTANLINSRDP